MLTAVFLVWCSVTVAAHNGFELFPSLPVGIVETDNVICKDESRMYVEHLKNLSLWAYQSEFKFSERFLLEINFGIDFSNEKRNIIYFCEILGFLSK